MMGYCARVCVVAALAVVPARDAQGRLADGVTLYLPLDGDATPRSSRGSDRTAAEGVTFTDGRAGRGASVSGAGVRVPALGNFVYPRGSAAFWVRPAWSAREATGEGHRGLFGTDNFALNYGAKNRVLFFMTGKAKRDEGYRWDYGCADYRLMRNWRAGEWHHVAISWDAETRRKRLYLDGELAKENETEWIRSGVPGLKGSLYLGSAKTPGVYDELVVWGRVLGADEVGRLVSSPVEVARELDSQLPRAVVRPAWPVDVGVYGVPGKDAASTIVEPGETFAARIPVRNTGGRTWRGKIRLSLLDFWEKEHASRERTLEIGPGDSRAVDVTFAAPERGVFKVALSLRHGGRTFEKDVASFAGWPMPGPPDPDSFFGHHVNSWSTPTLDQAARLGLSWNRCHNMAQQTWWPRVQHDRGEFTWSYDFHHTNNLERGIRCLGQFFGTPYWAAANGPLAKKTGGAPYPYGVVPRAEPFGEYVYRTVQRYKDGITFWEVWNEPEVSMFWNGSPEKLSELCRVASERAKAADPDCVIMASGFTGSAWKWHELFAKAGGLRHLDAVSAHFYYGATSPPEKLRDQFASLVDHFADLARMYADGRALPVWNTEGGSGDTTFLRNFESDDLPPPDVRGPLNWRVAALSCVQSEAILQSLGVVRSFQYLWQPSSVGTYANNFAVDMTNAPKPKLIARTAMAEQVRGCGRPLEMRRDECRLWAMVYPRERERRSVVLWWTGRGGDARIRVRFPGRVERVVDIMGNERPVPETWRVTGEPSYVHVAASATTVADALREARVDVLREPAALEGVSKGADGPAVPSLPDYVAPKENPGGLFHVDLRPHANMGFHDPVAGDGVGGWADEGPLNCLHSMPTGRRTFYGVPFDVIDPATNDGRSVVTLRGGSVTPKHPARVEGIRVGSRVRNLYFLHAAAWGAPGTIGEYVVHYADGARETIPLSIPRITNNWWSGHHADEESRPVPVRVTETADGKPAWRYVRAWEWQNPRRDTAVSHIDVVSRGGSQTPILIAITGMR